MDIRNCFLNAQRPCTQECLAYVATPTMGPTTCRLVNTLEKLRPIIQRPAAPPPPKVNR